MTSTLSYKGQGQPVFRIKYTTSVDGITWNSGVIVFTRVFSSWESEGVVAANVIKDKIGYRLYYGGRDSSGHWTIGLALSNDGTN